MTVFFQIIFASLGISFISLIGIAFFYINPKKTEKILYYLVAFSAGVLLGSAFLHLLPEASKNSQPETLYSNILLSFIFYFILEKLILWRHCHKKNCKVHSFGYMNLIGDGIHNFLDGFIIASAYLADTSLGIITTLAVLFHEIPQEISDFGVLVHSGFKKNKALMVNFLIALTITVGAVFGFFAINKSQQILGLIFPLAIGGFLYIAMSDLIPEIRNEKSFKKSSIIFLFFILGIGLTYLGKIFEI
ncbi:MAG: ZIP family metal transporter [Candidatus Moranbacteria bacterium]|nr:ZIP family metal transporter [Candidatus Moranbacteria bacterium]